MTYRIGFVGTGANVADPDRTGFAMAYRHAAAYRKLDDCDLVACADIVRENAEAFADYFGISAEGVFEDYAEMVREARPDVVSVCVPPQFHAPVVIGLAETGVPSAIHCEKPMASTWAECHEMVRICDEHGVKLTINHQRRFGGPFRKAKELLDAGEIGDLRRIEFTDQNLYDAGSHLFDLAGYFTDHATAEWVLAAVDYHEENIWFGAHNENQALAQWRYGNGVYGLASTGSDGDFVGCYLRLRGTEGVIEIGVDNGPALRIQRSGAWKTVDTGGESIHKPGLPGGLRGLLRGVVRRFRTDGDGLDAPSYIDRSIADVVRAVREDEESELAGRNALQGTELIFACWESARRRGRVTLPLDIDDNPLEEMVESGELLATND